MRWSNRRLPPAVQRTRATRITLLRNPNGEAGPPTQSVFLGDLNSPFGVALVGNELYVANTDAIVSYPYSPGDTKITAPGKVRTQLPGGPIDHHWTKSLVASPDGAQLYVSVGSNSNITENGIQAEEIFPNLSSSTSMSYRSVSLGGSGNRARKRAQAGTKLIFLRGISSRMARLPSQLQQGRRQKGASGDA
jgi:glucose/arabinose dehydrogenase